MKKIFVFILCVIVFSIPKTDAQSIWFNNPTNGQTIHYTAYGSSQTHIPMNLSYNWQNSSSFVFYYIKLFPSPFATQQSNQGNGISQWWTLEPGYNNWRIELFEAGIDQQYVKVAEQSIDFM